MMNSYIMKCSLCRGSGGLKSLGKGKYICMGCDTSENRVKFEAYNYRCTNVHTTIGIRERDSRKKITGPGYLKRNVI